jgi:UDP-N-acetylglucosamine acyltransferase
MIPASARIHPSSVVEEGAIIGEDVTIGPFCLVEKSARLGQGTELLANVSVLGRTAIGAHCRIFPSAVVGGEPQNVGYKGEDTELVIGDHCTIREGVTLHRGMPNAGGRTTVGNSTLLLAYSHVAHDCHVGNNVILSNNVMLAGHVTVGDRVILGGGAAVHQFTRIGHHAFIGGLSAVSYDVIPYGMLNGNPGILEGLNIIGMQRSGIEKPQIMNVRRAFKAIFEGVRPVRENAAQARIDYADDAAVIDILDFIEAESERALSTPSRRRKGV